MTAPIDIGLEQNDASLSVGQDDMFDLVHTQRELGKKGGVCGLSLDDGMPSGEEDEVEDGKEVESAEEDRVLALEADLDSMYDAYREKMKERDAKYRVIEARKKKGQMEEWGGLQDEKDDESGDDGSEDGGWEEMAAAKAAGDSSSDESDDDGPAPGQKRKRPNPTLGKHIDITPPSRAAQVWFSQEVFKEVGELDEEDEDKEVEVTSSFSQMRHDEREEQVCPYPLHYLISDGKKCETSDFEIVPAETQDDVDMWNVEDEDVDQAKQAYIQSANSDFHTELMLIPFLEYGLMTTEAVTLAQQLVNRRTTKTKLLNDGFNRYSLSAKDGLPSWFLDDEAKYYIPNIPVTKEAVAVLRARQRALDSRPIKKIAEAKGRKKLRAAQRLEKAMKKAEGLNATTDVSEREKARQIERLMRKGNAKSKKKEVRVVVARGAYKGMKGRPKGIKGRYAMVDARMKKEVCHN